MWTTTTTTWTAELQRNISEREKQKDDDDDDGFGDEEIAQLTHPHGTTHSATPPFIPLSDP